MYTRTHTHLSKERYTFISKCVYKCKYCKAEDKWVFLKVDFKTLSSTHSFPSCCCCCSPKSRALFSHRVFFFFSFFLIHQWISKWNLMAHSEFPLSLSRSLEGVGVSTIGTWDYVTICILSHRPSQPINHLLSYTPLLTINK